MKLNVKPIRERVLNRDVLSGIFLNLGSSITAEIAANSGFDWVLLDTEHGAGDHDDLRHQLQAVTGTQAAPIVRIASNEIPRFKRALDLGASGIMVPWISSAQEAEQVVAAMRYPPLGIRGVASSPRACGYGTAFDDYFAHNHELLTTVVQIEREEAITNIDQIAAVDGVDVLFVGPLDLSVSLGIPRQFDNPRFLQARNRVAEAARNAGKAAGILLLSPDQADSAFEVGFTFVALGSDGALVANGTRQIADTLNGYKSR